MTNLFAFLVLLLVFACVAAVLCYVAKRLIAVFKTPEPFATVIYCIVLLILLAAFVGIFFNEVGWIGTPRGWRTWH